ncbi:MAG: Obg family GTPase CgtA, partial [Candidatus Saccharimonadales bacterium]
IVPRQTPLYAISAQAGIGLKDLLSAIQTAIRKTRRKSNKLTTKKVPIPVHKLPRDADDWTIERRGDFFFIQGPKIERFASRTDFSNEEAVRRLRNIMRHQGIMHELVRQGVMVDQLIKIANEGSFYY